MLRIPNIIHRAIKKSLPRKGYVEVSGSIIPSPDRRWCGPEFKDDNFYLQSAEREAHRLMNHFQCTKKTRILDVGCGQGRLPIGIIRLIGEIHYLGMDVDRKSIDWCKRYIGREYPSFHFKHLNLYNGRYNKKGTKIDDKFRFEVEPNSIDIVYLYSVFSHTPEEDMRKYLQEFSRILDGKGKLFLTTFVEEDGPNISINPENYRFKCSGPLHVVRYKKDYLFSIFDEYGYTVLGFTYETETDGQSGIYLSKRNS